MLYKRLSIVLLSTITLFLVFLFGIHPFLSPTQRIANTRILVVEGWLYDYALKEVIKEFEANNYETIITTGGPTDSFCRVYIGGKLHFTVPDTLQSQYSGKPVCLKAYSSHVEGIFAHFTIWVNDSIYLGDAYTTGRLTNYQFPVDSCIKQINSVQIHFDNDKMSRTQDRDLFISSITINGASIPYNSGNMVYEQYWPQDTIYVPVYATYAENAAAELIRLGADSSKIVAITAPKVPAHKTYHSAAALKNYLVQHDIYSVNVVSMGVHSRRSWLSYEKALGNDFSIGIIAIENKKYPPALWWQSKQVVKSVLVEAAKYLYIRFWFDPATEA